MTLKITLTIDQENEQGVVLIGLLTKAYGRGEAGVSAMRIERDGPPLGMAEYREALAIKAAAKLAEPAPKKRGQRSPGLGSRSLKDGKANGIMITLAGLRMDVTLDGMKELWKAAGRSPNGVGATLSKLRKRGLVKRASEGVWKLTPQGLGTLTEYEAEREKVEHNDSPND